MTEQGVPSQLIRAPRRFLHTSRGSNYAAHSIIGRLCATRSRSRVTRSRRRAGTASSGGADARAQAHAPLVAVAALGLVVCSWGGPVWGSALLRFRTKFARTSSRSPQRRRREKPFNALLVGTDSRSGLTPEEQAIVGADDTGTNLSDTIILAHVDHESDHVTMVQFPRAPHASRPDPRSTPIATEARRRSTRLLTGRSNLVQTGENLHEAGHQAITPRST